MSATSPDQSESTRSKILRILRNSEDPFVTAVEVAEKISADRTLANYHLSNLEEEGLVKRKRAGSRAVGWWAVED